MYTGTVLCFIGTCLSIGAYRGIGRSRECTSVAVTMLLALVLFVTSLSVFGTTMTTWYSCETGLAGSFSTSFFLVCAAAGICAVCIMAHVVITFCFQRRKAVLMTVVHERALPRGPERINPVNVFPLTAAATRSLSASPPRTRAPPKHQSVTSRASEGYSTSEVVYELEELSIADPAVRRNHIGRGDVDCGRSNGGGYGGRDSGNRGDGGRDRADDDGCRGYGGRERGDDDGDRGYGGRDRADDDGDRGYGGRDHGDDDGDRGYGGGGYGGRDRADDDGDRGYGGRDHGDDDGGRGYGGGGYGGRDRADDDGGRGYGGRDSGDVQVVYDY